MGDVYTIFNGVFDWTDESWHTSAEKTTVQPGDRITSSLFYVPSDNACVDTRAVVLCTLCSALCKSFFSASRLE